MSEENKAIRIQTYGSSYGGNTVDILSGFGGDEITVRLPGVPTELKYKVPEALKLDMFDVIHQEFGDKLDAIQLKHGVDVRKKVNAEIVSAIRYNVFDAQELHALEQNFKNEVDEIINHFRTLMQAHLIDYAADKHKTLAKELNHLMGAAHRELDDVLALGEEALKNGHEKSA